MSALVNDAGDGDIDDLDKLRSGELARTARGSVLRVAGDPERVEVELPR